jgi:hypothetical protein
MKAMTEAEWLGTTKTDQFPDIALNGMLDALLEQLRTHCSARKLRLFACACCRRVWHWLGKKSRQVVEVAEHFADGAATIEELSVARELGYQTYHAYHGDCCRHNAQGAPISAAEVVNSAPEAVSAAGQTTMSVLDAWGAGHNEKRISYEKYVGEAEALNHLFRDIFGNPFRPIAVNPAWLTWKDGTVRRIARAIYDERAFDRLPILADALADAGCDDADILAHCRSGGEHVRGCWVVDLLLGKS